NGNVTGQGYGYVSIDVRDSNNCSASHGVKVSKVKVTSASGNAVLVNGTLQLSAQDGYGPYTWASNSSHASVDLNGNGAVTGESHSTGWEDVTITATDSFGCKGTFKLTVLEVLPDEYSFTGQSHTRVVRDNGTFAQEGQAYPQPDWPGHQNNPNPTCYNKASRPALTDVRLKITPNIGSNTVAVALKIEAALLGGVGGMGDYNWTGNITGASFTVPVSLLQSGALPDSVGNGTFLFNWSLSLNGGAGFTPIGHTENPLFIVYDTPVGAPTNTRLGYWCTRPNVKGAAIAAAVIAGVGPNATAEARFDLQYKWPNEWKVLDGHPADCGTLARLMRSSLNLLGVLGSQVRYVYPRHSTWTGLWLTSGSQTLSEENPITHKRLFFWSGGEEDADNVKDAVSSMANGGWEELEPFGIVPTGFCFSGREIPRNLAMILISTGQMISQRW
ncbi:MAG: hypothetical protein HY360_08390, partial [Verrucomicrobia bacterium]|nr:hypothetical protein [Verrucomicrobiota bacterium]